MAARVRIPVLMAALLGLAACQGYLKDDLGLTPSAPSYAAHYPYYAELCAASQFRKLPDTGIEIEGGGFGGHAVLYLNGVCREKDVHYPVLELCEAGFNAEDAGVGVSVNDHYENANWIAVEGRQFFFHGLLGDGDALTPATYDATVAEAKRRALLDGIIFRDVYLNERPASLDAETYKYQISLGTDYALNYARDRYCAKVPLTEVQMKRVVGYLNNVNAPYRAGTLQFRWSVVRNNCSHLYHNALAAAGVWSIWPVNRPLIVSAFSFPTPKNEFVNLVRRTNDVPIDDLEALYLDPVARRSLMSEGHLPTAPGALVELERIVQPNAVYDPKIQLVFYDDPTVGPYVQRFGRILAEPRYSDLKANFQHFEALYRKIERDRKPVQWHARRLKLKGAVAVADFEAFYVQYYIYIGRQREAVAQGLERMASASRAKE